MLSVKWRPACPGLNVLKGELDVDFKEFSEYQLVNFDNEYTGLPSVAGNCTLVS